MSSEKNSKSYESRLVQSFTMRWFALLFGGALVYSILRYHVLSMVSWEHFPIYILNKAVSLGAVLLIGMSYLIGKVIRVYDDNPARRLILIKFCGLIGAMLALIHVLMSFLIFSPSYYGKFFHEAGKLNLVGELSMLFGVLAIGALTVTSITSLPQMYEAVGVERWQRGQRMGYLALALVACHLVVMGWSGWLKPESWPGGLPPISLVAFVGAITPLLVKAIWRKKS